VTEKNRDDNAYANSKEVREATDEAIKEIGPLLSKLSRE
jgi:ribosome recycling factor